MVPENDGREREDAFTQDPVRQNAQLAQLLLKDWCAEDIGMIKRFDENNFKGWVIWFKGKEPSR